MGREPPGPITFLALGFSTWVRPRSNVWAYLIFRSGLYKVIESLKHSLACKSTCSLIPDTEERASPAHSGQTKWAGLCLSYWLAGLRPDSF